MIESTTESRGTSARRPIVVLLIDDQALVGEAIGGLLSSEREIEWHFCARPAEAVAEASRIRPAIILQDLVMPDMDGLTLLDALHANPATAATPIVVLSGNDDGRARALALARGAADYLVKPPTREELVACIRRHVRTRAPAGAQPEPHDPARAAAATPTSVTLDRTVIAGFRAVDPDPASRLVSTLVDRFEHEAEGQIATLKAAAARPNQASLRDVAHGLKGSARTMGANKLAMLCAQLERHAARNISAAVFSVLTSEIEAEFQQVKDALRREKELAD